MLNKELIVIGGIPIIAVQGNPNHFIDAPANALALTPEGDVYRHSREGGTDGWVIICALGGPRPIDEIEQAREEHREASLNPPSAESELAAKAALEGQEGATIGKAAKGPQKPK